MMVGDGVDEVRQKLTDAVASILDGTQFAPPAGGIVIDVVVIAGWRTADDDSGVTYIGASSPWATEGLLSDALRMHTSDEDGDSDG